MAFLEYMDFNVTPIVTVEFKNGKQTQNRKFWGLIVLHVERLGQETNK